MIFSGSSNFARRLLAVAAVTRKNRSKRFAWRAVADADMVERSARMDGWVGDRRVAEEEVVWTGANASQPGTMSAVEAMETAAIARVKGARDVAVIFIVVFSID